ncbi:hypothetical protein [Nocardia sp. NPDC058658]|uniref:hypothetical protein n=1 Tax=unclassified Nocardia TaxID=2637762 RepID=UPI00365EE6B8
MEPPERAQRYSADEMVARHRALPRVDCASMRQEAEEFFGSEDRIGDDTGR